MAIEIIDDETTGGKPQEATARATDPLAADPFDPLNAPRVDRDYSKGEGDFHGSVPEPQAGGGGASSGGGGMFGDDVGADEPPSGSGDGDDPFGLGDLPPNEKSKSANALADIVLDFYCDKLPLLFRYLASPNQKKLNDYAMNGEIDFTIPITLPDGRNLTIADYFAEVKIKIDEGFIVEEKWKEEFRPYLVDWLKQKGWGLTPEQTMGWMLIEDLGQKTLACLAIRSDISQFTTWCMSATAQKKQEGAPQPNNTGARTPEQPPPQREAPPVSSPIQEAQTDDDLPITPTEEIDDEDPFGG